ncbi:metacaspase-3-like isoform X2 [Andrographis paniculata]|uniref:metacaspase-3-like isoform X2 n=1 Tax=Andrographis paniculata TaxID=175694 RepID=UPI0021E88730|nr:metacaspase-3-like isoform X2 [Andrographis paniculata]
MSTSKRSLSLEIEKKKTEAKLLLRRFSSSKGRTDQIQTQTSSPRITPSDPSPRGNKRAFLCAVTYKKQKYELKGTAQDVKNIQDLLLTNLGFPPESILVLAEDDFNLPPTKANIEEGFRWLMKGVQPKDLLVFYFSGHGLRQRDFVRDEVDGFDETICPLDFQTNGNIVDNYINKVLVRPLIKDVKLHAIIDCCHSGTVLDLPLVYNMVKEKWEDNRPPSGDYKGTAGGTAICISACEDYQLAADTTAFSVEKEMNGAMTCAFIKAIKEAANKQEGITYHGILHSMHDTLEQAHESGCFIPGIRRIFHRRILQDPLLSSSEKFDIAATKFEL